jgi:hypothetical protein
MTCTKENERTVVRNCCEGLTTVGTSELKDGECTRPTGFLYCTKCGNGTCGEVENPCNCPEDCKK